MNQSDLLDLDDWELLPDEQIKGGDEEEEGVNIKMMIYSSTILNSQADHFICPQFVDTIIPPPLPPPCADSIGQAKEEDDPVSQVFFTNQQKEEMVIKVESPKSRGILPPLIEFESPFHLDIMGHDDYDTQSSRGGGGDFNIWKWSVSAISSLGVAAAALCILIFTNNSNNRDHPQNQKPHFPIHSHPQAKNRRVHQASTIMAASRGARVTRARIICGGYYKGTV